MFALSSDRGLALAVGGLPPARWLRRLWRAVRRVRIDDIRYPRFGASISTGAFLGFVLVYGTVEGGHSDAVVQFVTARTGFAIEDVKIAGNVETSEIDVLQQIGLDGWTSMIGFDVAQARARIAELPWVESVEVRKVYPARLEVQIVERKPFAIWQHGQALDVIEGDGDTIAPFYGGRLASLPLVIGAGADKAAPGIVKMLSVYPSLAPRVRAYIRVADRRWDLRMDNGVTIRLPERNVAAAVRELARLEEEYALLERDLTVVDLRLEDRITVGLSQEAADAHQDAFKQMMAARKKGARI